MRRLLVAPLLALGLAACGSEDRGGGAGALIWDGDALEISATANLPDDHIVGGRVRNDSLGPVRVEARDLRLVDARGRPVATAAMAFIDHYAHGIFPPTRREGLASKDEQEAEDRRLGRLVTLKPRQSVPLTVAWRQPAGSAAPVAVRYPGGELPLP